MAAYADGAKQVSVDATRGDLHTWRIGQKLAARLDIHRYLGVWLLKDVRYAQPRKDVLRQHVSWWPCGNSKQYQVVKMKGEWPVDFKKL
eukprot:9484082-Alexandrium_andersonii.AAC.1